MTQNISMISMTLIIIKGVYSWGLIEVSVKLLLVNGGLVVDRLVVGQWTFAVLKEFVDGNRVDE